MVYVSRIGLLQFFFVFTTWSIYIVCFLIYSLNICNCSSENKTKELYNKNIAKKVRQELCKETARV